MFNTGDIVFDNTTGSSVRILEKIDAWGFVSYKVFDESVGKAYKVTEDMLSADYIGVAHDVNYIRFASLLCKIKNETAQGLLSSLSNGVIPLPHQLHVLNRATSSNNIRYILADEVGLGKTIEAGMIIKELKARGLISRVLIVTPTGLVTQWEREMKDKFGVKFNIILPSDYDTIKRLSDNNDIYGQFEYVISPMDAIKPLESRAGWSDDKVAAYNDERVKAISEAGWDLIIIDEAHRVAGSSGEVARHKLGKLLSQSSPYILLLSATPHSGKTEPFLRLIRLLDEDAFPNVKSIVKEQVAPYLIRTEKREAIDNNGNRLFKDRITNLITLNWDARHSLQRELYDAVTEYVSKTYNKALRNRKKNMGLIFLLIIMQRMVTSSTAAIKQSLEKRLQVLQHQTEKINTLTEADFLDLDMDLNLEDVLNALSFNNEEEKQEIERIISIAKQATYQHSDVKVDMLTELTDKILNEDKNQKIIIFTEFRATQEYLQNLLISKGRSVTVLNGNMNIDERNAALKEFRDESNIFISTDAGGEGLNLQFCNIIINYDLPWNPMKIEQRCGRVDRIGQMRDVQIYNFILEETVENRVREVLENKLSVILQEIGVDKYSDVLDGEFSDLNFTNVYMNSLDKRSDIEYNIQPIESELKSQAKNTQKYKDIIRENKDLSNLIGKQSDFDVEKALGNALKYYAQWQNKPMNYNENIALNDEKVISILNTAISHDKNLPVLSISIPDFPTENGYFMIYKLSLTNNTNEQIFIPIFINDNFVLRPLAGPRILDVFLNPDSTLIQNTSSLIDDDIYSEMESLSKDFAHEAFVKAKEQYLKKNEESYNKYIYALKLREEAANHIGIENIKKARLEKLKKEKEAIEKKHELSKRIYPDFKLCLLTRLEV